MLVNSKGESMSGQSRAPTLTEKLAAAETEMKAKLEDMAPTTLFLCVSRDAHQEIQTEAYTMEEEKL